jgi:tetratricopeptide (TPR) repeat protein
MIHDLEAPTVKAWQRRTLVRFASLAGVVGGVFSPLGAQQTLNRTPDPNTPRIMIPALHSSEKGLGVQAQQSIQSRIQQDFPFKLLWVIPRNDIRSTLEASGYPPDEPVAPTDAKNLGQLLRADEYLDGNVTKTSSGFKYEMRLVLVRDITLAQPLPAVEAGNLVLTSSLLSKELQAARKQLEGEKKCVAAGREQKYDDAIAAARAAIAAYPRATIARVCLAQTFNSMKAPSDSIIRVADEILAIDPVSRPGLSLAGAAYADRKKAAIAVRDEALKANDLDKVTAAGKLVQEAEDKAIQSWTRLITLDPTNTRMVDDVVRQIAASANPRIAKPIIDTVVKQNPGDPSLLKLQWLIDLAVKEWKQAISTGEEMVKLDTALADTNFFTRMAAAYDADSQPQKGVDVVSRGTVKFATNVSLQVLYAQMLRRAGQTQQAVAVVTRLVAMGVKDPRPYRQLIQAYIDLSQPDSAMLTLRKAGSAGDTASFLGSYALSEGNKWYKRGQAAKGNADSTRTREIFITAVNYLSLADSFFVVADSVGKATNAAPSPRPAARFLLGASAFSVAMSALQDANKSKSCDFAKTAQQYFTVAQINLPAGGVQFPEPTKALLGYVAQYSPTADNQVKVYCK